MLVPFYQTRAYQQIEKWCEDRGEDVEEVAYLAERARYEQYPNTLYFDRNHTIDNLFTWSKTEEGQEFWEDIYEYYIPELVLEQPVPPEIFKRYNDPGIF